MRSLRGSGNEEAFSLFSFQDIMIAIMGILILITLILALNLTEATELYAASSEQILSESELTGEALEAQRERTAELLREYSQLKRQQDAYVQQAKDVAESVLAGEDGRRKVVEELKDLHAKIANLNGEVGQRKKELGVESELSESIRDSMHTIRTLREREKQLDLKIENQKRNPKLTYLVQRGTERRAILLELSDKRIKIGPAEASGANITLSGDSRKSLAKQFAQAINLYKPNQEYFVLLIKPSAFGELHYEIESFARDAGFSIGRELIPEKSTAFPDTIN